MVLSKIYRTITKSQRKDRQNIRKNMEDADGGHIYRKREPSNGKIILHEHNA